MVPVSRMAPRSMIRLPKLGLTLLIVSVEVPTRRTAPRPANSPEKVDGAYWLRLRVVPTPRLIRAKFAFVWRLPPAIRPTVSE